MKIAFPDKFVNTNSFLDLCNITQDYGYDGVEITDVEFEERNHSDSIFRSSITNDAKRKLYNRHINISAIRCPEKISINGENSLIKCIEYASLTSISNVVIELENGLGIEDVKKSLTPAIELAQANNVNILIETKGELSCTQKVLDIISALASSMRMESSAERASSSSCFASSSVRPCCRAASASSTASLASVRS